MFLFSKPPKAKGEVHCGEKYALPRRTKHLSNWQSVFFVWKHKAKIRQVQQSEFACWWLPESTGKGGGRPLPPSECLHSLVGRVSQARGPLGHILFESG